MCAHCVTAVSRRSAAHSGAYQLLYKHYTLFLALAIGALERERERKQVSIILPSLITNGVVLDVEIALWPLNDIRPTMLQ